MEAQALIDFVPHKGAVVTEISASDAADTYAIRLALEPAAFALSIPHLNEEDFARAADLIAEMDAEPDPSRMGELNRRFHMSLYARAGRPRLLALVEGQLAAFDRYLRFHLAAKGASTCPRTTTAPCWTRRGRAIPTVPPPFSSPISERRRQRSTASSER